jgi:putative tryptophan/tyrosine transport system substrate-binding protein
MRRREFIGGLAAAAWPLAAQAQQGVPIIGVLYAVSAAEWTENIAGFRRGLGQTGFVEGRNVSIKYHWAEGQFDQMPAMAADLVASNVAVILVGGNIQGTRATISATRRIPIVFTTTADPVAEGLVASLNRPGANVTGVTSQVIALVPKTLELVHEAIPAVRKFAVFVNPNSPVTTQETINAAHLAARRLGVEVIIQSASTEAEIDRAFEAAVSEKVGAVFVGGDAYLNSRRNQIAALSLRHALPFVGGSRENVAAGMLMGYGASVPEVYRQAGIYVGRILKGEKPSDLPVVQPTKFELVVNLKSAKAIGLTISEAFLLRADEVIE